VEDLALLRKAAKLVLLRACEALGLFRVSAWVFRKRLLILCYHGFQLLEECAFRPQLFMSRTTFESRLRYIVANGFKVIPLGQALLQLRSGNLPPRALVITIDDGFKSTLSVAGPLLAGMPATVYVTTYYMDKQMPIFRLAMQYVFWKARVQNRKFAELPDVESAKDPELAMWELIRRGDEMRAEQDRQDFLQRIAQALNVDLAPLYEQQILSIMSPEELKELSRLGIDVQLHTHRHRFPVTDRTAACKEIEENRARLKQALGIVADHFCYPSGVFDESQWPWLEALGIESATTCLSGLNRSDTPRYGLRRFLDNESVAFIEFKAELAGFNEILRWLRKLWTRARRESTSPTGN
jgi:peptidoglycan/xylan/chitin deacetylase (PgdA/CDA1 family)